MAYEIPGLTLGTKTAAADYSSSTSQFTCVKTTAAANFSKQVTAGGVVIGILQDTPSSGQAGNLMVSGVTKVRRHSAAAAISAGAALRATTSAGVESIVNASNSYIIGRALEAATTSQTLLTMLITHEGKGSTASA